MTIPYEVERKLYEVLLIMGIFILHRIILNILILLTILFNVSSMLIKKFNMGLNMGIMNVIKDKG